MKNPCYKTKSEQCTNRFVGCRETCDKWKLYDKEKRKEMSELSLERAKEFPKKKFYEEKNRKCKLSLYFIEVE